MKPPTPPTTLSTPFNAPPIHWNGLSKILPIAAGAPLIAARIIGMNMPSLDKNPWFASSCDPLRPKSLLIAPRLESLLPYCITRSIQEPLRRLPVKRSIMPVPKPLRPSKDNLDLRFSALSARALSRSSFFALALSAFSFR